MQTTATTRAEHELAHLAQQFEHWRQHRSSSFGAFPNPLCEHAVALTVLLPLSQVATQLRVRGTDLNKRCAAQEVAPSVDGTPARLHFVELPARLAEPRPTPSAEVDLIRPGQPRLGGGKDLGAVLLQRHQVLQGVHPRVETGGNQTGEHTGDVGTVLRGKEQRVLALPDEEL